ncbi:MAG TPA: methylmalonyl-CoA mutase [candidate division WOR-3 bacterium]|uniref:Methylmalonyl-CoA mutase n=1 Tax=candidate division WOR-3 bacterium TaxID=2052148 RepID=A0A7V0T4E1_UNCW3|nr:methylmalonyl-CoA mutase [candidate division WOR-3 bacterium]
MDDSQLKRRFAEWEQEYSKRPARACETLSGVSLKPVYTPLDLPDADYLRDLGLPGQYPFTRGIHPDMYRGRLWTMRQFAGFGSARDTNARYKFLLGHGETGLSVAFDFPTLYGRDSDDARARGEVGKCGVAISSLDDMATLFEGIPLDKVSTSMTINGPAAVIWAFYIAAAELQGVKPEVLRGTIQNDILKEYIAQKSWLFPPEPSMRVITDIMRFASEQVPRWNTISISGYHIREAGSTAAQELAFTLKDGLTYVEAGIAAGLDVDGFAPRLSYFFNSHLDFFEEVAKFRAARRIWAREMRETFKAKDPRSWLLRFHTQTAGCSLTAQQPENNIARTGFQALAAVLGGTQSLHTNSMDETWALPTEKAVLIALRTQQLIAEETGAASVADPLGGSWYVEALTDELERQAREYFRKIDALGGMVRAIEHGFPQREIADASYRHQRAVEEGRRTVVGVNRYQLEGEKLEIPLLRIDPEVEKSQCERLSELRRRRDGARVEQVLTDLREACAGTDNVMPLVLDAARARATLGEICQAMKDVFGEYVEPPMF